MASCVCGFSDLAVARTLPARRKLQLQSYDIPEDLFIASSDEEGNNVLNAYEPPVIAVDEVFGASSQLQLQRRYIEDIFHTSSDEEEPELLNAHDPSFDAEEFFRTLTDDEEEEKTVKCVSF